mgnify:CR=1 FL=1
MTHRRLGTMVKLKKFAVDDSAHLLLHGGMEINQ